MMIELTNNIRMKLVTYALLVLPSHITEELATLTVEVAVF